MFGYRTGPLEYFGKSAARLDDLLNFLPARIAGLSLVAGAALAARVPTGPWRSFDAIGAAPRARTRDGRWLPWRCPQRGPREADRPSAWRRRLPIVSDIERSVRVVRAAAAVASCSWRGVRGRKEAGLTVVTCLNLREDWNVRLARYACRGPLHALSASATVVSLVGLPGRVAPSARVENRRSTGIPPAIDGRPRTRLSHTASSRDSLLRARARGPSPGQCGGSLHHRRPSGALASLHASPSPRGRPARTIFISVRLERQSLRATSCGSHGFMFTRLTPCAKIQRAAAVRLALRPAFSSSRRGAGRVPCYESAADRPVDGRSADGAREGGPARARRVVRGRSRARRSTATTRPTSPWFSHGSRSARPDRSPTSSQSISRRCPRSSASRSRGPGSSTCS